MNHYEKLRKSILDGFYLEMERRGLALLLHQGMKAWIKVWTTCLPKNIDIKKLGGHANNKMKGLNNIDMKLPCQVVDVLSSMVLSIKGYEDE